MKKWKIAILVVILTLILTACGNAPGTGIIPNMEDKQMKEPAESDIKDDGESLMAGSETMMENELESDEMSGDKMQENKHADAMGQDDQQGEDVSNAMNVDDNMMSDPAWFSVKLIDARSGESFTIKDFSGKVILVETFAVWCSTCLRQQREILSLHEIMGDRDDFISINLDIDPNENAEVVKSYIERNGFHWRYAVAPVEVGQEIGNLYGSQFLNPPSAPVLLIDSDGEVHPLPFGVKSAEQLREAVGALLDNDM